MWEDQTPWIINSVSNVLTQAGWNPSYNMLKHFKNRTIVRQALSSLYPKLFSTAFVDKYQSQVFEIAKESFIKYEDEKEEREFAAFCENLSNAYIKEQERKERFTKRDNDFKLVVMASKTPIRDSLKLYTTYNKFGFDEDLLADSFGNLAVAFLLRGRVQPGSHDISYEELYENWRFKDMIKDLKYAFQQGVQINEKNLAKIFISLKHLAYRDTELSKMLIERTQHLLNGTLKQEFHVDPADPLQSYQFGKKSYYQTVPSAEEVLQSTKFRKFADRIMRTSQQLEEKDPQEPAVKDDINELNEVLDNLTKAIEEKKLLEKELTGSILAIKDQFKKLSTAQKHDFIILNPRLMKDLYEVEELLIESGLLSLEDLVPRETEQKPEEKIQNASKTLRDLLIERIPQFFDPQIESLEDAYQKYSEKHKKPKDELHWDNALVKEVDFSSLGIALGALAETLHKNEIWAPQEQLSSDAWKSLLPELWTHDRKNNKIRQADLRVTSIYTDTYQQTYGLLVSLLQTIEENLFVISPKQLPIFLIHLSNVSAVLGHREFFQTFVTRLNQQRASLNQIDSESLYILLNVLNVAPAGSFPELAKITAQQLSEYVLRNGKTLNNEQLIRAVQFFCVHDLVETHKKATKTALKHLEHFEFGNLKFDLDLNLYAVFQDVSLYLKFVNKDQDLTLSPIIDKVLAANPSLGENPYSTRGFVDPLKELLRLSLERLVPNQGTVFPANYDLVPTHIRGDLFFGTDTQQNKILLFIKGHDSSNLYLEGSSLFDFRKKIVQKLDPLVRFKSVNYLDVFDVDFKQGIVQYNEKSPVFEQLLESVTHRSDSFKSLQNLANSVLEMSAKIENEIQSNQLIASSVEAENFKKSASFLEGFIRELHRFFSLDRSALGALEKSCRLLFHDKLRYQLAVLNSLWNLAPEHVKSEINGHLKNTDFPSLLHKIKEEYPVEKIETKQQPWMGVRLGLELPGKRDVTGNTKDLVPEILNHEFLMDANYHQYPTWKTFLESTLNHHNLNFDINGVSQPQNFHDEKRALVGITPRPDGARNFIKPYSFALNWEYYSYEFPQDVLIDIMTRESQDLQVQKEPDQQTKYMINLQNLKFEIKSDLKHSQIVENILGLDLIEGLISQHLGLGNSSGFSQTGDFVERTPEDYSHFLEHQSRIWIFKDRYANFILEEANRREEIKQTYRELKKLDYLALKKYKEGKISGEEFRNSKKVIENKLKEKLRKFQLEENDPLELSKYRGKNFRVDYDIQKLIDPNAFASQFDIESDPDFYRAEQNLNAWLDLKLRKAESNLIKLAILHKLHTGVPLKQLEKQYLSSWKAALEKSELVDLDVVLLPKTRSVGKLSELSQKDKEFFKQLVNFDFNQCQNLAVADVVFELSQFFDTFVVDKTQLAGKLEQLSSTWGFRSELLAGINHTKETRMIHEQVKEYTWRKAGQFNEEDRTRIHEMFSVLRGKSQADRVWFPVDKQSLDEFLDNANEYDDRNKALEEWLQRKEEEIANRVVIKPHPDFVRPDSFYRRIFDKKREIKMRKATEELFGIEYNQLTKQDLHVFTENFLERLYIIKKYLPSKLIEVVKGVISHPNISMVDKRNLISALKANKVDIQDKSTVFVAKNPIEIEGSVLPQDKMYHDIDELQRKISAASTPYVQNLAKLAFSS